MTTLPRRQVLEGIAAAGIAAATGFHPGGARAQASLPSPPKLAEDEALLLTPADARYGDYQIAYNKRTIERPALRALCKTPAAISAMVEWVREHDLPFALRSGGHSYEGFSQSTSVVIDTRLMNGVALEGETVAVGAGCSLGTIYKSLAAQNLAIPAGSCPTVGISGHVLGGGFGFLARALGVSCDSLTSVELVDPQGRIRQIDSGSDPDLLWACRGGGGGSFGAVTRLHLRTCKIDRVTVFGISWLVPAAQAVSLMSAWQGWAPHAPDDITSFLRLSKSSGGVFRLRCAGQSTGSQSDLRRELRVLLETAKPAELSVETKSFLGAVDHFSGGWNYESSYSKGKSAYVETALSDDAIATLFAALDETSPGTPTIVCDAYGGAIAKPESGDTAFVHRAGTLYCMQYGAFWESPSAGQSRIAQVDRVYAAMQPHVSRGAYVNYCDLELTDWAGAYWGSNVGRLRKIKTEFDPENIFRHAQSI